MLNKDRDALLTFYDFPAAFIGQAERCSLR